MTRLRETRQYAMSQRQAFTFQYDDTLKQIKIIDHNTSIINTPTLFSDPSFPNNTGSTTLVTIPLAVGGVPTGEISYGIPSTITGAATTLGDGCTLTALTNSKLTVTFQPDGRVVDGSSNPVSPALFFYNNKSALQTASAISILGSGGRVKMWTYNPPTNTYAE
jgi:hypothetical protein